MACRGQGQAVGGLSHKSLHAVSAMLVQQFERFHQTAPPEDVNYRESAPPNAKELGREGMNAVDGMGQIGGGGIRTPETLTRLTVFKTVAFSRSATPPR